MLKKYIKKIINIKKSRKEKGFSLVETLVGITILLISVIAPMSIVSQAVTYTQIAKDEIIANNLAQEAVEYIRNERDKSFMAVSTNRMANFLAKFGTYTSGSETYCYDTAYGCGLDVRQTNFSLSVRNCSLTSTECGFLHVNNKGVNPTYTYTQSNLRSDYDSNLSNWTPTTFKRVVKMRVIGDRVNPREVEVLVNVSWTSKSYSKTISVKKYLTSWEDGYLN